VKSQGTRGRNLERRDKEEASSSCMCMQYLKEKKVRDMYKKGFGTQEKVDVVL
jgi:hypothetical protein